MTDLTKDEAIAMAREAGAIIDPQWGIASNIHTATFERFATLCRAPLIAEVERLNADMKQMGADLCVIQEIHNQQKAKLYAALADWKARALKSEQEVPKEWRDTVQEFVSRCESGEVRSKKTYAKFVELLATPPQPAAREPASAVPVVEMMVDALSRNRIMAADSDGNYTREVTPRVITAAIAAGQQYLKENGK